MSILWIKSIMFEAPKMFDVMFKNRTRIKYSFTVYAIVFYLLILVLCIGVGYVHANFESRSGSKIMFQALLPKPRTIHLSRRVRSNDRLNNSFKMSVNSGMGILSQNFHKIPIYKKNPPYRNIKELKVNSEIERFLCLWAKVRDDSEESDDEGDDTKSKQILNIEKDNIESLKLLDSYHSTEQLNNYDDDDYVSSMLPKGCEYDEHDVHTKTVICEGRDMISVPIFKNVRSVDTLIFNATGIQVLDRAAIEGLPMVNVNLVFMQGVLMRVSFVDLIYYQQSMTNLTLIHNSISSISFSNFYSKTHDDVLEVLDLRDNLITSLPEVPVQNETVLPYLRILILSGNPVGVIPGDIFYPLRMSPLKTLFLRESGLSDYGTPSYIEGSSPLVYLKQLEILDLSRNPQFVVEKLNGLLEPLSDGSLKELILDDNSYLQVPTAALNAVKDNLKILSMARSSLYCLDSSSFPIMPKLDVLDLQFSRITQIKAGTFDPLISLRLLNLNGNILTVLPYAVSLPTLEILYMNQNPSDDYTVDEDFQVYKNSLNKSQKLQTLSMRKVPIKSISNYFFEDLFSLEFLDLSKCQISFIEDQSFRYLSQLKKLHLPYNKIKQITKLTFEGLSKLEFLDLSYNALDFVDETGSLKQLVSMPQFVVEPFSQENKKNDVTTNSETENDMSYLPLDIFHNTYNLKYLYLKNNKINFLHSVIFEDLTNLRILDLSYNRIKIWADPLFGNSPHLDYINLRYNDIDSFTEAMIEDFSKPHLIVDLRNNIFTCSCSLLAFDNELNDTLFVEEKSYKCRNYTDIISIEDYLPEAIPCEESMPIPDSNNNPKKHVTYYGIFIGLATLIALAALVTYRRKRWYFKYLTYKFRTTPRYDESKLYEYDTFVCYAQADRQWIFEKLITKLESTADNFKVCVHERDFVVGEEITQNIMRSVELSRKVIVVISREFVKSYWCKFELQVASNKILDERKNKLILLILESIPSNEQPKELKILLKTRTYVNYESDADGEKQFWCKLLRALSKPTSTNESDSTLKSTVQTPKSSSTSDTVSLSTASSSELFEKTFNTNELEEQDDFSDDEFSTSHFTFKSDADFGIINGFYVNEIDFDERSDDIGYINLGTDLESVKNNFSKITLEKIENSEV